MYKTSLFLQSHFTSCSVLSNDYYYESEGSLAVSPFEDELDFVCYMQWCWGNRYNEYDRAFMKYIKKFYKKPRMIIGILE